MFGKILAFITLIILGIFIAAAIKEMTVGSTLLALLILVIAAIMTFIAFMINWEIKK